MAEHFRERNLLHFDTKQEFYRENFHGLLRYRVPAAFQLLCGRGHKILQRRLSRMVLKPRKTRVFSLESLPLHGIFPRPEAE